MARATTGAAYLTLGLVILGGLVFAIFVVVPSWGDLRAERQRLAETAARRDERQAFLRNVETRARELAAVDRHARALGVAFPETVVPADLAAVFHALGSRNGVIVEAVSEPKLQREQPTPVPSPPPAGPVEEAGAVPPPAAPKTARAPAFEFTLTLRGTYAQLRGFLSDLERSLRLFNLPTLTLTATSPEPGSLLRADVTVVTVLVPQ